MNINLQNRGYTIIETMISVAIFLLIIQFGMGALLGANSAHQKSRDMNTILDSLSFAMEDISRNIRTGYNYQCFRKGIPVNLGPSELADPSSCNDGWALAFESDVGNPSINTDQVVYYIDQEDHDGDSATPEVGRIWKSSDGLQTSIKLTADEIDISLVSGFAVLGAESPNTSVNRQQPFVTIRFKGEIRYKDIITPFSIQTSASQRLIDI